MSHLITQNSNEVILSYDFRSKYTAEQKIIECCTNKSYFPELCDSFIIEAIIIHTSERIDQIAAFELICQKEQIINIPGAVLISVKEIRIIDDFFYIPVSTCTKYLQIESNQYIGNKGEIPYAKIDNLSLRLNASYSFEYKILITSFFYAAAIPKNLCYKTTYYKLHKMQGNYAEIPATLYLCGIYVETQEEIDTFFCQIDKLHFIKSNRFAIKIYGNHIKSSLDLTQIYKKALSKYTSAYICKDIEELLFKYLKPLNSNLYYFSTDSFAEDSFSEIKDNSRIRKETTKIVHRMISLHIMTLSGNNFKGNIYIKCNNIMFLQDGTAKLRYT